jgi:hypothetical protein
MCKYQEIKVNLIRRWFNKYDEDAEIQSPMAEHLQRIFYAVNEVFPKANNEALSFTPNRMNMGEKIRNFAFLSSRFGLSA